MRLPPWCRFRRVSVSFSCGHARLNLFRRISITGFSSTKATELGLQGGLGLDSAWPWLCPNSLLGKIFTFMTSGRCSLISTRFCCVTTDATNGLMHWVWPTPSTFFFIVCGNKAHKSTCLEVFGFIDISDCSQCTI